MAHVQSGAVLEFIGLDNGHGTGQVGLLLGTVTHHDEFVELVCLDIHGDVDVVASEYVEYFANVTEAVHGDFRVFLDPDGESAFFVGDCCFTAGDHHGGTRDREPVGVPHDAVADVRRGILGQKHCRQNQQQKAQK